MGFLDRMMAGLVADATGINARTARKMLRGKGLLMLASGAALAGGAAAWQKKNPGQGPSAWANPSHRPQIPQAPPPPPPPSAVEDAVLPPLPPTPPLTAEDPEAAAQQQLPPEVTYALVRTMVAAALADGDLAEQETSLIHHHLDDSGLSPDQVKQVQRDLVLPPLARELAEMTEDPGRREAMYRFAGFVVLADERVSDLERSWLDRLAEAFGFSDEHKAKLEEKIFAGG